MTTIYITDDGDETCFVKIDEEVIGIINHEDYAWDGMAKVIQLLSDIAESFGIPIVIEQNIV